MKYWTLVLVTVLLITSCLTKENEKKKEEESKKKKKKKNDLVRYITNWDSYQIPTPVNIITLRDVLEKIALYKQNLYCPFGDNECVPGQYSLSEIIIQIVKDSIAEFGRNNKTENLDDETLTGEPKEKEKGNDQNGKHSIRTQHLSHSEMDFSDMKNILIDIIQFGDSIHNKPLSSARRILKLVYGAKYDFFNSKPIVTLLFVMPCIAERKNKKESKIKENPIRYVSNWGHYKLPKRVPVDVLKQILAKVALYKRNEFCPFGINMCDLNQVSISEVTVKIINDAVTEYQSVGENTNVVYENDVLKNSNSNDDFIKMQDMLQVLGPTNEINSTEFMRAEEHQKLFAPRYKPLKLGKRKKGYIKNIKFESWGG